jgi:hypothetical protein
MRFSALAAAKTCQNLKIRAALFPFETFSPYFSVQTSGRDDVQWNTGLPDRVPTKLPTGLPFAELAPATVIPILDNPDSGRHLSGPRC